MNVLVVNASGLPARSVRLPVCKVKLYLVLLVSFVLGVIVKVSPFIFVLNGIDIPLLFVSTIQSFPALIGSLNLNIMLAPLLAGLTEVTLGSGPVLKLLVHNANELPARSVILLVCNWCLQSIICWVL